MISIVRNYTSDKSPISHKYLNHGKYVPIKKCFKFKIKNNLNYIRLYSTSEKSINSKSLKGIYKEKSALYGRTHSEETKAIMSRKKSKIKNPLFGKIHTENTKELMNAILPKQKKALGRKHSFVEHETLLKMSASRGYQVYIYEKYNSDGFTLIGIFVSIRRAAIFLAISSNTITRYINSGEIFKDKYKFTGLRIIS